MMNRRMTHPRTRQRPARSNVGQSTAQASSFTSYLSRLCKGSALGIVLSLLSAALLSVPLAGIFLTLSDPDSALRAGSAAVLLGSTLLCGAVVGHVTGERWLFGGGAVGMMILLLILLANHLIGKSAQPLFPTALQWALRAGVCLFAAFGTYLGSHMPAHRRKQRRKRT